MNENPIMPSSQTKSAVPTRQTEEHIDASVVTVTFNSAGDLREFWGQYRPADFDWIVVDNASEDDSVAVAQSLGARVLRMPRNVGFSAANNAGAAASEREAVVFANPDVGVSPNGLRLLVARLEECGGIVAPQLVNSDGSLQENGRGIPYPIRKLSHMLRPESTSNQRYIRVAEADQLLDVLWVMGAAVAIKQSDFRTLNGWDSRFFVYYEDSDLGIRARLAGMPVRVDGAIRWRHGWARETAGGFKIQPWLFEFQSALRFYLKHPYCVIPIGRKGRMLATIDRYTLAQARTESGATP